MSTGLAGMVIMVGRDYILVRGRNGQRYKITTTKPFKRCDEVWLYFKNNRTVVNVERRNEADPDIPHVEVEEPDHFQIDLGDVDCGE